MRRVALLVPLLLAGCLGAGSGPAPDVATSFYPLEFLAARIGGENVTVSSIVKPGVEPHDYEPTTTDLAKVSGAKLLVMQGAGFEAWIETARRQAGDARVVLATDGLDLGDDPHAWLDPVLFAREARNVEAAMVETFPEHAASFAARADALVADLEALDAEFQEGLDACELRLIITNHDAFGHLAARYAFEAHSISGLEPDAEPDPGTMSEIVRLAKENDVRIVFFEDLVSPRVAEVIAEEAGATTRVLSPVEGILPDEAAQGADYLSVMRDNLAGLREAMRCA